MLTNANWLPLTLSSESDGRVPRWLSHLLWWAIDLGNEVRVLHIESKLIFFITINHFAHSRVWVRLRGSIIFVQAFKNYLPLENGAPHWEVIGLLCNLWESFFYLSTLFELVSGSTTLREHCCVLMERAGNSVVNFRDSEKIVTLRINAYLDLWFQNMWISQTL